MMSTGRIDARYMGRRTNELMDEESGMPSFGSFLRLVRWFIRSWIESAERNDRKVGLHNARVDCNLKFNVTSGDGRWNIIYVYRYRHLRNSKVNRLGVFSHRRTVNIGLVVRTSSQHGRLPHRKR